MRKVLGKLETGPRDMSHPAIGVTALVAVLAGFAAQATTLPGPYPRVEEMAGTVELFYGEQKIGTYVYADESIPRPYFKNIRTIDGLIVTRPHPPQKGDPDDHATYHPGVWLAFGDLSGADFWRNKAEIRHLEFAHPPTQWGGHAVFSVVNGYFEEEKLLLRERCDYLITTLPQWHGSEPWILLSRSTFEAVDGPVTFGDQEEMGFGVRVATPLMVKNGGRILNSFGQENEAEVWGKQAAWADYSGKIYSTWAGVCIFSHRDNFRIPWFHARDYGLLLANPFGRNAFTKDVKSEVVLEPGERLQLQFALLVHSQPAQRIARKWITVPITGTALQHMYEQYFALTETWAKASIKGAEENEHESQP